MIAIKLPRHVHLSQEKGLGWPVYLGCFLADGAIAVVAGRSARWQRLLVFDPSLALLRELEITSSPSDHSQPEGLFRIGDDLLLVRRWGPNLKLDARGMAVAQVEPAFAAAGVAAELPRGGVLIATAARNRGEQTELLLHPTAGEGFSDWLTQLRRVVSPIAGEECGRIIAAGERILLSSFTTMKSGTAGASLVLLDGRMGEVVTIVPDDDVIGRDGDIAWDGAARQFLVVNPKRGKVERWSADLEVIERHELEGTRLLAIDARGRGLWFGARRKELTLTEPSELPITPAAKASGDVKGYPALEVLFSGHKWSVQKGDVLRFPPGQSAVTLGAGAGATFRVRGAKKMRPIEAHLEKTGDGWILRCVDARKVWVDGAEVESAPLTHGAVCFAGLTFRFLERPWVIARNPEMEAAVEEAPDDDARWSTYAAWLRAAGDPLGDRMAQPRPQPTTEDARWLGELGPRLANAHYPVLVEWRFGLPVAMTLHSVYDVNAVLTLEETRFLRRLTVDLTSSQIPLIDADVALRALAATPRPKLLESLALRVRPLETPSGPFDEGRRAQARVVFEDVKRMHPRLTTTWETLFEVIAP